MIRLLRFLFTGSWHEHKWKTINEVRIGPNGNFALGRLYVCRCQECGKITKFDISY